MFLDEFRDYCLSKKGVTESTPFDEVTLVFKVGGKMFSLTNLDHFESINLKCDPDTSITLREMYQSVKPGYHMNKKHWNTIKVNDDMSDKEIYQWVDHSYDLVFKSLTKKIKEEILAS